MQNRPHGTHGTTMFEGFKLETIPVTDKGKTTSARSEDSGALRPREGSRPARHRRLVWPANLVTLSARLGGADYFDLGAAEPFGAKLSASGTKSEVEGSSLKDRVARRRRGHFETLRLPRGPQGFLEVAAALAPLESSENEGQPLQCSDILHQHSVWAGNLEKGASESAHPSHRVIAFHRIRHVRFAFVAVV